MRFSYYRDRYATGLLISTLGFAVFGLMVQITSNGTGIDLERAIHNWFWTLAGAAGALWVFLRIRTREQRHPTLCKGLFAVLLMLLICLMVYAIFYSAEDFRFRNEIYIRRGWNDRIALDRHILVQDALYGCRLFGRAETTEEQLTIMKRFFLQWENDAVLPVMCLSYGLWMLLVYMGLFVIWIKCAIGCLDTISHMPALGVWLDQEKTGWISIPKALYCLAAAVIFMRLLGPLVDFIGLCRYSGGVPFMYMHAGIQTDYVFIEIVPYAAIGFVLCFFRETVPEPVEESEEVLADLSWLMDYLEEIEAEAVWTEDDESSGAAAMDAYGPMLPAADKAGQIPE